MRSTTTVLTGLLAYKAPVIDESSGEEISPGKHILMLNDISLISTNKNNASNTQQSSANAPWLNLRTFNRT